MRNSRLSVNPDRHARGGQGLDPAFAFARRGLVSDEPYVNPALLRGNQCLDNPRASSQPIGTDQDFALGVVDGTANAAQSSSGVKQTAMAAPEATEEAGRMGANAPSASDRATKNTQKLYYIRLNSLLRTHSLLILIPARLLNLLTKTIENPAQSVAFV